jgi:hypothetical protein
MNNYREQYGKIDGNEMPSKFIFDPSKHITAIFELGDEYNPLNIRYAFVQYLTDFNSNFTIINTLNLVPDNQKCSYFNNRDRSYIFFNKILNHILTQFRYATLVYKGKALYDQPIFNGQNLIERNKS